MTLKFCLFFRRSLEKLRRGFYLWMNIVTFTFIFSRWFVSFLGSTEDKECAFQPKKEGLALKLPLNIVVLGL